MTSFIGLQTPDDWFHLFWFGLVGLDSKFNNYGIKFKSNQIGENGH